VFAQPLGQVISVASVWCEVDDLGVRDRRDVVGDLLGSGSSRVGQRGLTFFRVRCLQVNGPDKRRACCAG
jgi:hypothetical protein